MNLITNSYKSDEIFKFFIDHHKLADSRESTATETRLSSASQRKGQDSVRGLNKSSNQINGTVCEFETW